MKKILVPTDFSSCATNALDFAAQSAKIIKAELTLLHVFDMADYVYPETVGADLDYRQSMLNEVTDQLLELKNEIGRKDGITISTSVYEGTVTEGILQTIDDLGIDFVVMGTSGASGLKEKLIGSETAAIIGKAKTPILAIPDEYKWKKPEEIVLATNHFEDDPVILDFLFELAYLFSANISAIVFTDKDDKAIVVIEHTKNAFDYEKMLKEQYRVEKFFVKELIGNEFENTIEQYIVQNKVDLLAVVTYKKTFIDRLLHPSIAKKMSYHTKIPLLVFPAANKKL
jgi:nucleotide-binding universal stress UspA family protein